MATKEKYDSDRLKSTAYIDLPGDDIDPARKLLEQYSGIPAEDVDKTILDVVCVGSFRPLRGFCVLTV